MCVVCCMCVVGVEVACGVGGGGVVVDVADCVDVGVVVDSAGTVGVASLVGVGVGGAGVVNGVVGGYSVAATLVVGVPNHCCVCVVHWGGVG